MSPLTTLTEEWTLDALGNPTYYSKNRGQSGATTKNSEYGETSSQLTVSGSTSYTYDSQGRQDQTGNNTDVYTWSWYATNGTVYGFQRQGANTSPATRSVLEEYRYDALGRRILLRSRPDASCTAAYCKAAVERYVWDGNQKLYEVRVPGGTSLSSSALEVDTATGPFFGKVGYVLGAIDSPLSLDRDGLVVMPHANWRGLYDTGTDTTGASCCSTVDWMGRDRTAYLDGPQPTSPSGWAGSLVIGQLDQSGLKYSRNRYYDPSTGRFTQSDPIGLAGGINHYGFAGSDPVNRRDPLGLWPDWLSLPGWLTPIVDWFENMWSDIERWANTGSAIAGMFALTIGEKIWIGVQTIGALLGGGLTGPRDPSDDVPLSGILTPALEPIQIPRQPDETAKVSLPLPLLPGVIPCVIVAGGVPWPSLCPVPPEDDSHDKQTIEANWQHVSTMFDSRTSNAGIPIGGHRYLGGGAAGTK